MNNIKGIILSTGATLIGKQNNNGDFEDCIIIKISRPEDKNQVSEVMPIPFGMPLKTSFTGNKVYKHAVLGEFEIDENLINIYMQLTSGITLPNEQEKSTILNNRGDIFKK